MSRCAHEGDAAQQLAVASRGRPLLRHGDDAHLGARGDLAVHPRVVAGDVLGHVAVEAAHEVAQRSTVSLKARQRAMSPGRRRLRRGSQEPVPASPEVVEAFDELVEPLAAGQQVARARPVSGRPLQRVVGEQPRGGRAARRSPARPSSSSAAGVVRLEVVTYSPRTRANEALSTSSCVVAHTAPSVCMTAWRSSMSSRSSDIGLQETVAGSARAAAPSEPGALPQAAARAATMRAARAPSCAGRVRRDVSGAPRVAAPTAEGALVGPDAGSHSGTPGTSCRRVGRPSRVARRACSGARRRRSRSPRR